MTEQSALSQVAGLKDTIAQLERSVAEQQEYLSQLQASYETQLGVNRQLMAKKEEVEWQLMSALAQVGV